MFETQFSSVAEIVVWERGGGEARAGLPANSFDLLTERAITLRLILQQLRESLGRISYAWSLVTTGNEVSTLLPPLLASLIEADGYSQTAQEQAGSVYAEATQVHSVVKSYMQADEAAIQQAQIAMSAAQTQQIVSETLASAARAELQGDKGFLNGFITGITFSIVNPLQENLNAANNAATAARAAYDLQYQLARKIRVLQSEKATAADVLGRLQSIQQNVNSLLNSVQKARKDIPIAISTMTPAERQSNEQTKVILLKIAGRSMDDLTRWIGSLQQA